MTEQVVRVLCVGEAESISVVNICETPNIPEGCTKIFPLTLCYPQRHSVATLQFSHEISLCIVFV
jgi:hypothetical protein